MGVDGGNLQVIDVDIKLENCPITFVRNLLLVVYRQYNTIQYHEIIVVVAWYIITICYYRISNNYIFVLRWLCWVMIGGCAW